MRKLLPLFFALTLVIYQSNDKTDQIKIYELSEDFSIEIVCAEGVSRTECLNGAKEEKRVDAISYDEIVNFVIDGPYRF